MSQSSEQAVPHMSPTLSRPEGADAQGGITHLNRIAADWANRVAVVAVASLMVVALTNIADIVLRNFFQTSLFGVNEINLLLVAVAASACLPNGVARKSALTIDMLTSAVPPKTRAQVELFASLLVVLFFGLLSWRMGVAAYDFWTQGLTTVLLEVPRGPFFMVIAIFLGFAALIQTGLLIEQLQHLLAPQARRQWAVTGAVIAITLAIVADLSGLVGTSRLSGLIPTDPMALSLIMFALMWVLILLAVPIGVAMGLIGVLGTSVLLNMGFSLQVMGAESAVFITRDGLSTLPMFVLMGSFAAVAGIGQDFYRLAQALVGHLRGGLAYASVMACAGFGMLTGSSVATQLSIGRLAMAEMRARKYSVELASGAIASGGTLGQLIPPSSALILYAVLAEESVGRLFVGAIIPGFLAALLYMSAITLWLILRPGHAPRGTFAGFAEIADAVKGSWSVLLLLGAVLGGIYFGFFTELEAGSVGALGAFVIAVARGKLSWGLLWSTMGSVTTTLAMIYTLIFGVTMLSFFFGLSGLPELFTDWITGLGLLPLQIILCLVIAYLVLGTVMDAFAMMVITIPIFVPLVESLGYDPIWWGLMTLVCMEAGQISPPFGLNIFVIKTLDPGIPLWKVFLGVLPFFASTLVKIALLIVFPALVTWLPSTM